MRNLVVALIVVASLTACHKSVDIEQHPDGSQTIKVDNGNGTSTTPLAAPKLI